MDLSNNHAFFCAHPGFDRGVRIDNPGKSGEIAIKNPQPGRHRGLDVTRPVCQYDGHAQYFGKTRCDSLDHPVKEFNVSRAHRQGSARGSRLQNQVHRRLEQVI